MNIHPSIMGGYSLPNWGWELPGLLPFPGKGKQPRRWSISEVVHLPIACRENLRSVRPSDPRGDVTLLLAELVALFLPCMVYLCASLGFLFFGHLMLFTMA